MSKTLKFSIIVVFAVAVTSLIFTGQIQAANVQFTADTQLNFTSVPATVYVKSGSECDSLTVSASTLNADIPAGSTLTLKTASYTVLGLTPSGGTVTLAFDTSYFSSGYLSQWTASSSEASAQVSFLVGVSEASADYLVRVDGSNLGYFQSSGAKEVTFTYSRGFSSKIFTIVREDRPTGGGGTPAKWFMPPKPPIGGFQILINNGAKYTDSKIVTLNLTGGPDTARMAISNFSDFQDAGQETYTSTKTWDLCKGLSSCPEGEYKVYVKFYASWGTASEVVSDSIILKTLPAKPINEMTIEELKTKIAEILEKIAQLKVQLQKLLEKEVLEIPVDYKFEVDLKYGQSSDGVRYLQIFLKTQGPEIYPEGIVSGWFGPLTKKAVIRFQEKYAEGILAPWGLTKGTSFVGKTTQAKINEILSR